MHKETLEEKIRRVVAETVEVVSYDDKWPGLFEEEKKHLLNDLPANLILRIEHFGSTSVPGLAAKPVVDMIIEISDVDYGKKVIPEVLEPQGYDCFWRPLGDEDIPPFFTWCIKRNESGNRTHHLHFVGKGFKDEELRFRDILRSKPKIAEAYGELKTQLSQKHRSDRVKYTKAKGDFIRGVLRDN
jgi:GrpB-like predicted nucleotidyltransferase (UPF0157 family)